MAQRGVIRTLTLRLNSQEMHLNGAATVASTPLMTAMGICTRACGRSADLQYLLRAPAQC